MVEHICVICPSTVTASNFCTRCRGSPDIPYTPARPIATAFPGHGCMDDLTTERSFDSPATWAIDWLGSFHFDMLSMIVGTTRHWQTFGRLVEEVGICTIKCMSLEVIQLAGCLAWHGDTRDTCIL